MQVIITGSSRGIGRAIAQKFLKSGNSVIGIDLHEPYITHENYTHYYCDLGSQEPPDIHLGEGRVLINNAGTENEALAMDVNFYGTVRCTEKYALHPGIHAVINIASFCQYNGAEGMFYCTSKAAITGYTRATAHAIAKYGACANSISPGGVDVTAQGFIVLDPDKYKQAVNQTLLGKWVFPEELASLCEYLAYVNKSITGQDIIIEITKNAGTTTPVVPA